jgi:hypothetical protein
MRVHVTVHRTALADEETRSSALRRLAESGLRDVDESRFQRFGVASGEIDPTRMPDLEKLTVVEAVEPDRLAVKAPSCNASRRRT